MRTTPTERASTVDLSDGHDGARTPDHAHARRACSRRRCAEAVRAAEEPRLVHEEIERRRRPVGRNALPARAQLPPARTAPSKRGTRHADVGHTAEAVARHLAHSGDAHLPPHR